jgi:hypothetical protein
MGKEKGYVVLEVGYEYNDEYYHTGNNGETYEAPKKVFINKDKAEIELHKKNMEHLRGLDLGRYGYILEDICKKGKAKKLEKICEQLEINIEEGDDIPKDATDEQINEILKCLDLEFFTLVEVEIE